MANFIRSWQFMAIIIGVLTLAAGIGVFYGVTTHTEPGLMEETPGFDAGDAPIPVCTVLYVGDAQFGFDEELATAERLTRESIEITNDRLGFMAYRYIEPHEPGPCLVRVSVGEPSDPSWMDPAGTRPGGNAEFVAGRLPHSCMVATSNTGTDEILGLVIQHELGHCLGLAHDPFESSIMRPVQTSVPMGSFPPRITDSDRALLRHLFGH